MSDLRAQTLDAFAQLTGLKGLTRVIQRGRDPETARFTFKMDDGRELRIGTVDKLMSRAQLNRVLAVAAGTLVNPCKPSEWNDAIAALIKHATDVTETPGESFEDTTRDWLTAYAHRATSDRDGALPRGLPFTDNGDLYLSASDLAKFVRREYSEQVRLHDLRQALSDLGFVRETLNHHRGNGTNGRRTSSSYYRAPLETIEGDQ